jgi:hypothetical protein
MRHLGSHGLTWPTHAQSMLLLLLLQYLVPHLCLEQRQTTIFSL